MNPKLLRTSLTTALALASLLGLTSGHTSAATVKPAAKADRHVAIPYICPGPDGQMICCEPPCVGETPTRTRTRTPTSTGTRTPTNTPTLTLTPIPTNTPTFTLTPTSTHTSTDTPTLTTETTPCAITFIDVQPTDYFYEPVTYLSCQKAISGYSDGTFRPSNNTTRGQLAKIVVLAERWTVAVPSTATFRDVPVDHPFFQYIETANARHIISGYACGDGCLEFRPGSNVTRGQLSKIIVLAQGWALSAPATPTFSDVPTTDTFYPYVETAYNRGIISGYACGRVPPSGTCLEFRPGNEATRGQISKITYLAVTRP